jgi:ribonuclease R
VIPAGAFIRFGGEHADIYEGFLPARRMPGDRFEINEVESALIGLRTGRRVGIGDAIEVGVDSVEPARGRVDLSTAGARDDRRRRGGRKAGRRR